MSDDMGGSQTACPMRPKQLLLIVAIFFLALLLFACSSSRQQLRFADREWHVSDYYGQIIDSDTTYRMTFGNVLIPDPLVIISSADSVAKYDTLDRFMEDVLHTCGLDDAQILFYAPQMNTMFVIPAQPQPPVRPVAISVNLADDRPYTMWVDKEDSEDWTRDETEMYGYAYLDKGKKRLIIVDQYHYGDTPIAQLTIFQSKTKATSKINIPIHGRNTFFHFHDIKELENDIEFWAHNIESTRHNAFANYKIGLEQKLNKSKK